MKGDAIRLFLGPALLFVLTTENVRAVEAINQKLPPSALHLFVLAGQSNMAGRASVEAIDKQIDPRVFVLDESLHWKPAVDPLHFDKPQVDGVGIGKSFAIAYADANPGVNVGLIPCAVGGTSIKVWAPSAFHKQTKTHPWDDGLVRIQAALKDGELKGILWHQGESDTNQYSAPKYEQRLTELIQRYRSTFHAPDVPFIIGQLGQFKERPWNKYRTMVDAAQKNVCEKDSACGFVSSDNLVHGGDNAHFSSSSVREFGRRYYHAYSLLTENQLVH